MCMSQGIPIHAGYACEDCSFLAASSRSVYVPTTSMTVNQALHGHLGGPTYYCDDWYKDLDSATPWACQCHAELPASIMSSPPIPFCLSFISSLLLAAVLMNISWPGTSVNSPGSSLHSLGRYQRRSRWLRKDVCARKPSREQRTWVGKEAMALLWADVSCPLLGDVVTVSSASNGLPADRGWPHVRGGRLAFTVPLCPLTRV